MRNHPTIDETFKLAKLLGVKVDDKDEEDEEWKNTLTKLPHLKLVIHIISWN